MHDFSIKEPVPSIVYYVSGHGFGHATRSAAIMNELHLERPEIPIHVRTWASPEIFRQMCPESSQSYCQFDLGVVQQDGITMDIPKTLANAHRIFLQADISVETELNFLQTLVPGCIISDIPPIAHRLANRLGVPSLTVTNFTWDWIYEDWSKDYPLAGHLAEKIHSDYCLSNCLLRLPYSGSFTLPTDCIDMPMLGRPAKIHRDEVRRRLGLASETRPLVLLSFGGMGLHSENAGSMEFPPEFCFVSTFPIQDNSIQILKSLGHYSIQYPDLVGAVDVVITKPGYGIVSECAVNQTRMLYTDRGPFREYNAILEELDQWNCAAFISRDRLLSGRFKEELEGLLSRDPRTVPRSEEAIAAKGAKVISSHILNFYDKGETAFECA